MQVVSFTALCFKEFCCLLFLPLLEFLGITLSSILTIKTMYPETGTPCFLSYHRELHLQQAKKARNKDALY